MFFNSFIVIDLLFNRKCGARARMLTISGSMEGVAVLPAFRTAGSDRLIAGNRSLKVVLTTRKIRTTISTSISETMMMEGALRFVLHRNFIHLAQYWRLNALILASQKLVT